jgi:hypothetical protein
MLFISFPHSSLSEALQPQQFGPERAARDLRLDDTAMVEPKRDEVRANGVRR